jgi:hypothetical protein
MSSLGGVCTVQDDPSKSATASVGGPVVPKQNVADLHVTAGTLANDADFGADHDDPSNTAQSS